MDVMVRLERGNRRGDLGKSKEGEIMVMLWLQWGHRVTRD